MTSDVDDVDAPWPLDPLIPGASADAERPRHPLRDPEEVRILARICRFLSLLAIAWCVMLFTHEAGHIVCGWAAGGTLRQADLRPWAFPYSLFEPDPRPLITLWGGPLLGVAVPSLLARVWPRDEARFVASFCWLANGLYLAVGWVAGDAYLDTTQLLRQGAHPLSILVFCTVTIGWGYTRFRRECVRLFTLGRLPVASRECSQ